VVTRPQVQAAGGRSVDSWTPAAVSQEAMVWHEQFVPGSFNLPCLVRRYQGPLDVPALDGALRELVRRHEPLRSTFTVTGGRLGQTVTGGRLGQTVTGGRLGQHVGAVPSAPLEVVDLAGQGREARVEALLADASRRPFDLTAGPLFEPRLVRLDPDDHLLVVRLHHTVFDDWSVDLFRRELSALYRAYSAGEPSPLVELRVTFTDFCGRERARLDGGRADAERAWWRRELDGAPFAVQLPLSRGSGEPVRVELPASLSASLRAVAPTLRATAYMTALAAFSLLVARWTGQDDLLLSTVVAHRNESDLEPLIGCFTKKVPLRLRVDGDPSFAELVARTRASLLGSLTHQDLAFDAAVHEGVGRAAAAHGVVPRVAVVFQGETPRRVELTMPDLVTTPYQVGGASREERHFSASDAGSDEAVWGDGIYTGSFVIVSLVDAAEGMGLVARGVFDRPAGRRLLEALRSLLEEVVADPTRALS
jgi:hypothetical protein